MSPTSRPVTPSEISQTAGRTGDFAVPRRVHLVGCCGSGMKGLADLLHGGGHILSGSDNAAPPPSLAALIRRGMAFHSFHDAAHVPADAAALVYSAAVPPENVERQRAAALGIPQFTYSEMLGELMSRRLGVCIAGTHGKSTTTAMTSCILSDAGFGASAIFGADLCDTGVSSWAGPGDVFVAESCEFHRSFLDLHPRCAAILSVEPDHFDCFADRNELVSAFQTFAQRVHPEGFLLVRHEDRAAAESAIGAQAQVLTFGWSCDADWWAADVRRSHNGSRFRVFRRGQFISEIALPQPGRHNVLNALAAAAVAFELGVAPRDIRASLAEFPGIRRRFEVLGSWRGVTMIDDYAHHPTAVETTLQTARDLYGRRTIRLALQPHQVSRTTALLEDFARSCRLADQVIVAPVYAAREQVTTEPVEVSARLAERMRHLGLAAQACTSLDHLAEVLDDALLPGDVLITMGAGDIDRIHHAFTRRFSRDSQAGRAAGTVHVAEGRGPRTVLSRSA